MATTKPTKTDQFPKMIHVTWEGEDLGDRYLVANETIDEAEDGQKVAIYELREVRVKRVTHELE